MRIFIAFPVAETIQAEAASLQQMLRKKYPSLDAKWVAPANMHITLEFLGTINERQLAEVKTILQYQTKKALPFLYRVTGLAVFPDAGRPETLVVTVAEVELAFSILLRTAVHEDLTLHNISNDFKLWRPHMTLARVRPDAMSLAGLEATPVEPQVWQVNELHLIASNLTAHGAEYTVLQKFPLG